MNEMPMEKISRNIKLNINIFKNQNEHFGRTYILTRMAFMLQHSYCDIRVEIEGKKYLKNLKTYLAPTLNTNNSKVTVWRMFRDLKTDGYIETIKHKTDILYTLTEKTFSIKNGKVN